MMTNLSSRQPKTASPILIQVLALLIALLMIAPLLWVASISLKSQRDIFRDPTAMLPFVQFTPTGENWLRIFEQPDTLRALTNSTLVAGASTFIAVSLGSLAGYGLARFRYGVGNQSLIFFLVAPRLIPPIVIAIPWLIGLREMRLMDSLIGVILAHTTLVLPFAILIMREYFAGFSNSVMEAARADGAGFLQVFQRVAMPNARPAVIAAAVVCFIFSWNDLSFSLIFTNSPQNATAPLLLLRYQGAFAQDWGSIAALVTTMIALPIVLSLLIQRFIFTGLSLGIAQE